MLHKENKAKYLSELLSFNPFWDASVSISLTTIHLVSIFQSLLGCFNTSADKCGESSNSLSIPFGMLLIVMRWINVSSEKTFNPFWDASELTLEDLFDEDRDFQSLLGCFSINVEVTKQNGEKTFNPFWDASQYVACSLYRANPLSIPFGMLQFYFMFMYPSFM